MTPSVFPRVAIFFAVATSLALSAAVGSINDNAALGAVSSITITEDLRITGGDGPSQVAVNSATHTVYVSNPGEQTVTVLEQDGDGNSSSLLRVVDTIEVPNAFGIAVNPTTNMVYVSGYTDSYVYVVDGSVNRVISAITVGSAPRGVAADPSSNKVYVTNFASNSISVIDGATNKVIDTIKIGEGDGQEGPRGLAIDREAGVLYVANWLSDSVSIIDISTNTVVGKVLDVGSNPSAIAVNEKTGKVYVAGRDSVSVINASNGSYELIGNLPVPAPEVDDAEYLLGGIAISQETNLVYFTNMVSNSTTLIDGNDDDDTIVGEIVSPAIHVPKGVAIDENWDVVYIANQGSNSLMLVDGSSQEIKSSVQIGGRPSSVAFNPETDMVYVGNYDAGTVSIMNGSAGNYLVGILAFGQQVMDVEVNYKTNRVYVLISTVEPDGLPRGTIVVIDGNTSGIVDRIGIDALAPSSIAVNTETDVLYIGHDGYNHHTITVIDGSTNQAVSSINTGYNYPLYLAVNENANKLYVAIREPSVVLMYEGNGSGAMGDSSEPTTMELPTSGMPAGIAVNPETDMVYMTDYWNGTVSIIDGSSAKVIKTLAGFASPTGVAVNAKTNTVYVADNDFDTLAVIDGSSNEVVAELVTDKSPLGVSVNSQSGAVYVTNADSGNVLMYDESQINASKFRMAPFSLTAKVITTDPSASTDGAVYAGQQQGKAGNVTAPVISGRAQDVKVTDIVIRPQENMMVINYMASGYEGSESRGHIRGGIIEVTLPASVINDIYRFRLEGLARYLQIETENEGDNIGFAIHQGDYYPKDPAPKYAYTSINSTSNTVKFIVPLGEEESIGIYGANVMPGLGTGLERHVQAADRIVTGMVTDKESFDNHEDVWISVYQWLKNGRDSESQIMLRVEGPAGNRELDLAIGEEVLLMLEEIDISRGYFGLYHPDSEMPLKYPPSLRSNVSLLVQEQAPAQTEDEELQRLPDIDNENCRIMELDVGDSPDKFLYCTYEEEDTRFYVPISVTLELAKRELLKHVSEQYFAEHFNLIRASDTAFVNGHAVPVGQSMQFEYTVGNFTFDYSVIAELGHEDDDRHLLYLEYTLPREITSIAIEDEGQIERIIYDSSCLPAGTPYVLHDRRVLSHADRGFSPFIDGRGPPDVFDRHGNQIVEAEKRFQLWLDTGEIQCTDNVKIDDEIDDTIGRRQQVVLMDASVYLDRAGPEPPVAENDGAWQILPLVGIGAAIAGIIAFVTLKKIAKGSKAADRTSKS